MPPNIPVDRLGFKVPIALLGCPRRVSSTWESLEKTKSTKPTAKAMRPWRHCCVVALRVPAHWRTQRKSFSTSRYTYLQIFSLSLHIYIFKLMVAWRQDLIVAQAGLESVLPPQPWKRCHDSLEPCSFSSRGWGGGGWRGVGGQGHVGLVVSLLPPPLLGVMGVSTFK